MGKALHRGRLLVDWGFQLRLMARAAVYIFLCTFVSLNIGFFFEYLWVRSTGANPDPNFYLEYMSQHRFILIGSIVLLPAILFDLLKFSNRVAGPLHRCRSVMTQMSRGEQERLTRRYTAELSSWLGPERDVPAPDVGTNEQTMAWVMDTYSMHVGQATTAVVTGKPIELGGSRGRKEATGRGVMIVARTTPAAAAPVRPRAVS